MDGQRHGDEVRLRWRDGRLGNSCGVTDERFTVGVEEEYLIVDAETLGLRPVVDRILPSARLRVGDHVEAELLAALIEVETSVCESLGQVRDEVGDLRAQVAAAAAEEGRRIVASGTHPFSTWRGQDVTDKQRYHRLAEDYQQLAREQLICGCHVHVAVSDRDVAIRVIDRTRPWLPVLLALTANSPFWEGLDTGYASYRTAVFDRWPTSGPPIPLGSRKAYDEVVDALVATGSIPDSTELYWDVRPSARYDTVEFRIADVCATVDETVMLAGLARSLTRTCHGQALREEPVDHPRPELVRAARWRAARHGLEGELVDLFDCRAVPAGVLVERLLNFVRPDLEEHGEWDEVASLVRQQVARGSGARRQREAAERGGVVAVAAALVDQTVPPPLASSA
jgi:carboxylate-amine ligase